MKRLQPTTQLHLSDELRRGQMQLPVNGWGGSLCFGIGQGNFEFAKSFSQAVNLTIGLASPRFESEQDYTVINPDSNLEAGDRRWLLSQ